jgi:hypothetical protein
VYAGARATGILPFFREISNPGLFPWPIPAFAGWAGRTVAAAIVKTAAQCFVVGPLAPYDAQQFVIRIQPDRAGLPAIPQQASFAPGF